MIWFWCFLFQAEDGIRDLVRSRGLGDVYKRQFKNHGVEAGARLAHAHSQIVATPIVPPAITHEAVSYTHLTLPTSDLV